MIVTASLLALGFAMTAQAGPRLYEGSLIIHAFGNDATATTGTTAAFTTNLPLEVPRAGAHCNTHTFHVKETKTFPTYYNTNTAPDEGNGNYNVFTIPSYGGQVASVYFPDAPWWKTRPAGCGPETLAKGAPLTGQGSIHTTGNTSTSRASSNPRGFTLIASDLYGAEDGASARYRSPYLWEKRHANLRNQRGVFCEGCGPGRYDSAPRFSFSNLRKGERTGKDRLGVTPGANKFGGTMKLLGTVYTNEGFGRSSYDSYISENTWLFDYVGAGAYASGGAITAPAFGQDYNHYIGRYAGFTGTHTVQAFALSWTTGTATVSGSGSFSPFITVMARAGFDHRTAHGYGEIQMVSPMLTRWIYDFRRNRKLVYHTGAIGILKLRFTPEPQLWMLLGAGLSLLGLLYRAKRRSR
jgi:hypothetical protein